MDHWWNQWQREFHLFICLCLYAHAEIYYIYAYIYILLYNTPTKIWPAVSAQCWSQPQLHVKNSIGPGSSRSIYLTAKLPPCCIDVRWCKMFHHVEPASRGMSFQLALKLRSLLLMQSWSLGPIMTHDCQDKICPSIPRVPTSYSPAGHFVGAFVSRSFSACHGDWLASCASLNLHFAGGRTNH
jgi:hypothetical protein